MSRPESLAQRILLALCVGLWSNGAWASEPTIQRLSEARVAEVRLISVDASEEQPSLLFLTLEGDRVFLVPNVESLPLSEGIEVTIDYQPGEVAGVPNRACRIVVTAIELEWDGERRRQPAQRPFEVFRDDDPGCGQPPS